MHLSNKKEIAVNMTGMQFANKHFQHPHIIYVPVPSQQLYLSGCGCFEVLLMLIFCFSYIWSIIIAFYSLGQFTASFKRLSLLVCHLKC